MNKNIFPPGFAEAFEQSQRVHDWTYTKALQDVKTVLHEHPDFHIPTVIGMIFIPCDQNIIRARLNIHFQNILKK